MDLAEGWGGAYHLCRFSASYREFQISILLPVAEEQRKLGEEAIIGVTRSGDGLRVGVAVDATFKGLCSANQFLPSFEIVGIVKLRSNQQGHPYRKETRVATRISYQFNLELLELCIFLLGATIVVVRHHALGNLRDTRLET